MASKYPVPESTRPGSITVTVTDIGGAGGVLSGALVNLYSAPAGTTVTKFNARTWEPDESALLQTGRTDNEGKVIFAGLEPALYLVKYQHHPETQAQCVEVGPGLSAQAHIRLQLLVNPKLAFQNADCQDITCPQPKVGDRVYATVCFDQSDTLRPFVNLQLPPGTTRVRDDKFSFTMPVRSAGPQELKMALQFAPLGTPPVGAPAPQPASYELLTGFDAERREPTPIAGTVKVSLSRTETEPTSDLRLWGAIRAVTEAVSFDRYMRFMDLLFCADRTDQSPAAGKAFSKLLQRRFLPFTDTDAYRVLKVATEAFVVVNCGVFTGDTVLEGEAGVLADLVDYLDRRDLPRPGPEPFLEKVDGLRILPYLAIIRRKLPDVPINDAIRGSDRSDLEADLCDGFIREKLRNPCLLELIWSVLARRGDAGPDDERDRAAVSEHPRLRPPGPAGERRSQPVAAAEQSALGLHPGRAAPAQRGAAQRRVRPRVRAAPRRPRGAGVSVGRLTLQVHRGLPSPAAAVHGVLQARRRHHRQG